MVHLQQSFQSYHTTLDAAVVHLADAIKSLNADEIFSAQDIDMEDLEEPAEAPAEEAPTEEAPAEEVPAEEASAEDAPAEGTEDAEEASAEDAPAEGTEDAQAAAPDQHVMAVQAVQAVKDQLLHFIEDFGTGLRKMWPSIFEGFKDLESVRLSTQPHWASQVDSILVTFLEQVRSFISTALRTSCQALTSAIASASLVDNHIISKTEDCLNAIADLLQNNLVVLFASLPAKWLATHKELNKNSIMDIWAEA